MDQIYAPPRAPREVLLNLIGAPLLGITAQMYTAGWVRRRGAVCGGANAGVARAFLTVVVHVCRFLEHPNPFPKAA